MEQERWVGQHREGQGVFPFAPTSQQCCCTSEDSCLDVSAPAKCRKSSSFPPRQKEKHKVKPFSNYFLMQMHVYFMPSSLLVLVVCDKHSTIDSLKSGICASPKKNTVGDIRQLK